MMIATTPRDNIPTLTLHTSPAPDIQISNSAQHTQYAQHLLRMQEDSPLLVSLLDSSDCLRYANRAFEADLCDGPWMDDVCG